MSVILDSSAELFFVKIYKQEINKKPKSENKNDRRNNGLNLA